MAYAAEEIESVLERWARSPDACDLVVLHAAFDAQPGERQRAYLSAVVARPSWRDGRYSPVTVGSFATPDAQAEQRVMAGVEAFALQRGVEWSVHPPAPGCAVVAERWIERQPPPEPRAWTVEWRKVIVDARGIAYSSAGSLTVVATTPIEARVRLALDVPVPPAVVASAEVRVRELGEAFGTTSRWAPSVLSSTLARALVRRLSAEGASASEMFAAHPPIHPLDGMEALALAWNVCLADVAIAGAFLRGEVDARECDPALAKVSLAREYEWLLAHRIAEAIALDRASPELVASARAAGPLTTIKALMDVTDLGLGEAKSLIGELGGLQDVTEIGTLSRELERIRAYRRSR